MTERRIYFVKPIGLDGPIKIGCSSFPERRLSNLWVWSPWPLEIIGSVPGDFVDEAFLHKLFADQHTHREWFFSSAKLRETIETILSAGSVTAAKNVVSSLAIDPSEHSVISSSNVVPIHPVPRKSRKQNSLILLAVQTMGRQSDLATAIGCAQQTISKLLNNEIRVSAEQAVAIDRATRGAVSKHDLRPDLFGRERAAAS